MRSALLALTTLSLTLCVTSSCGSVRPASTPSGASAQPRPAEQAATRPHTDPEHTYAMLINGGGRREINYQSHIIHLKQLVELLRATEIAADNVTIFSADGSNPAPDLATRELMQEPALWLLPRGNGLRPSMVYVDSKIDGFTLEPARKDNLRVWFETTGKSLGEGDVLLLYVTDHGEKNAKDLTNNTITLWNESLSVDELRELIAKLDPGVRVVQVMSQCFSGAFARTMYPADAEAQPSGNVCGYFSVTADRPAYGCYPENRGKEGIGHSHTLFEALDVLGFLPEANRRIQVTDRTPDVPYTSSDFYLEQLLQAAAKESNQEFTQLTDGLLATAWGDRAAWEPEIRLLDRIGRTFGTFSPRSLKELESESETLPDFGKQLGTYGQRWGAALEALKLENWQQFLTAQPKWREWLDPRTLAVLDGKARRDLLDELLPELESFSRRDEKRYARLESLYQKAQEAGAAAYRMEVRLGAMLRMRMLLTNIAGRVYLAQGGTRAQRATYERLVACEALALGPQPTASTAAALEPPQPFPTLAHERSLVEKIMPAWMGIEYRPLPVMAQKKRNIEKGAVVVTNVFADSPAAGAGLQAGDVILGPPDAPFTEQHAVREWTMSSEIGRPAPLKVLRDEGTVTVSLRPSQFPLKMPELPGPPPVGAPAPPLKLGKLRGGDKVVDARSKLLFFWATWCLPCKAALPEVLAFGRVRGVDVLAVTDEDPEVLEQFFATTKQPFVDIVAVDTLRSAFRDYGVSGTPTFVLVDEKDVVRHYQSGYEAGVGLKIDGWKWSPTLTEVKAP